MQRFTLVGDMAQRLPHNLQARANANYYSSISTQQRYNQDMYQATNRSRRLGGNLTGVWGRYSVERHRRSKRLLQRRDVVSDDRLSSQSVDDARRAGDRLHQDVFRRELRVRDDDPQVSPPTTSRCRDQGLSDLMSTRPCVFRSPSGRSSRSTPRLGGGAPTGPRAWTNKQQVEEPIGRRYFDLSTRITGPVFNRIWTPNNGYAEKFKHVIEPSVTIAMRPTSPTSTRS